MDPAEPQAVCDPPRRDAVAPGSGERPLLTYGILALLAAIFASEQLASPGGTLLALPIATLIQLGGLAQPLVVERGELYRLFTAPLLHADAVHLFCNGLALWMAGVVIEPLCGRAWLFALFFVGAIAGSLLSIAINPAHVISVGASGAILAMLPAAMIVALRLPEGPERTGTQIGLLRVLIPSLLPVGAMRTGARVDFAAHLGGTLAGCALGAILLATWPRDSIRPKLTGVAMALAAFGAVAFGWGGFQAHASYAKASRDRAALPATAAESDALGEN